MSGMVQEKTPQSVTKHCKHCDSPIPKGFSKEFCCHGCETAFALVRDFQLENYYKLGRRRQTPPKFKQNFDSRFYDDHNFQKEFCEPTSNDQLSCHIFLDNLDCYACSWVCEKAIQKLSPESTIAINLSSGQARIDFNPKQTKLSSIVEVLYNLGYPPSPNRSHSTHQRREVIKLGIAFFCFMNIMLLATAEYLGHDLKGTSFFHVFRAIGMVLAAASISFAGTTFFHNTFRAVIRKQLHLDLPISLALVLSFLYSSYNVLRGEGPIYFDSLSAIIFLLLVGRFFQKSALTRTERAYVTEQAKDSSYIRKMEAIDVEGEVIPARKIKQGDLFKVLPGDIVPVEAQVKSGHGEINLEFMTGESRWEAVQPISTVPSGAVIGQSPLVLESREDHINSYLQELRKSSSQLLQEKGRFLTLSKGMANFLVLFILGVSTTVFLAFAGSDMDSAIQRSIATLLIACPCAFGLGAPLIMGRAFNLGIFHHIVFKSQRAIEKISQIRQVYFDKTGTLTDGLPHLQLVAYNEDLLSLEKLKPILVNLPNYSNHHIPLALKTWGTSDAIQAVPAISNFKETFGQGISFHWEGHEFRIGRQHFCNLPQAPRATFYLAMNQQLLAAFATKDGLREGTMELVSYLKANGIDIGIISGDSSDNVDIIAKKLDVFDKMGNLSPKEKHKILSQSLDSAAMVGNGVNDSLALAEAPISIVVKDSSFVAQENADIVLSSSDLRGIIAAHRISRACRKALIRGFSFAFAFNLVGISLGATGYLLPVVAAILMPISSLTIVYISTSWEA